MDDLEPMVVVMKRLLRVLWVGALAGLGGCGYARTIPEDMASIQTGADAWWDEASGAPGPTDETNRAWHGE